MEIHIFFKKLFKLLKIGVFLIIIPAALGGYFGYYKAKKSLISYSTRATFYPETPQVGGNAPSIGGAIGQLIGANGGSEDGGFKSNNVNLNITYLATSDAILRQLSDIKPANSSNTYAQIAVDKINNSNLFSWQEKDELPITLEEKLSIGAYYMKQHISASILPKTNVLAINFSFYDSAVLQQFTADYMALLMEFYKNTKIEKLTANLKFLEQKKDSISVELLKVETQMIKTQNTTLFADKTNLEYSLPEEKKETEKQRLEGYLDNLYQQISEAKWNIQKETPVVKILEQPQKPYFVAKTSKVVSTIQWSFIFGIIFLVLLLLPLLIKFGLGQLKTVIADLTNPEKKEQISS